MESNDKTVKYSKSAGGVVMNAKGEILVVNQKKTSWSLPKGHIENNEDALKAAKREIFEESGLKNLALLKDLGSYQRRSLDDKYELKNIEMFLFETSETSLKPQDPENPEAKWADKDDVVDILTHPKDKEFFSRIQNEI